VISGSEVGFRSETLLIAAKTLHGHLERATSSPAVTAPFLPAPDRQAHAVLLVVFDERGPLAGKVLRHSVTEAARISRCPVRGCCLRVQIEMD